MAADTKICNLALSHLAIGKLIADLSVTQVSEEGKACQLFYPEVRLLVLRDFNWPFATAFADLSLVAEAPTDEWGYSYRYPSECVNFRRILSGIRNDNRQSRVPYRLGRDTTGRLIYTDRANAECEFTYDEDDADRFDHSFVMAAALMLASYIAPRLTAGDPNKLGTRALQLYRYHIALAKQQGINEEQEEEEPDSEFIRVRDGLDTTQYPYS